jgi:hypothetical protein
MLGITAINLFLAAAVGNGASAPEIGVAVAQGSVSINQRRFLGTATIFNGSLVETSGSPSTLLLPNNLRIDLAGGTSGIVHKNRLVLKDGTARSNLGQGYALEAESMVFRADGAGTSDALLRRSSKGVELTVNQGQVSVLSREGLLLARVAAGDSVRFETQAGASGTGTSDPKQARRVQLTGTLEKQGDKYFLTDRATKITHELTGKVPDVPGKVVTVLGELKPSQTPTRPAERVVLVDKGHPAGGWFPCFSSGGNGDGDRVIISGPLRQANGHYLVTDEKSKVTSELVGNVPDGMMGKMVSIKGIYTNQRPPVNGAEQLIAIEKMNSGAGGFMSACQKAWIGASIVTATGVGLGIALTREDPVFVSR